MFPNWSDIIKPTLLFGIISLRAGTSTRVPEVRVGYTNYPGTNLLPVIRMLIIECEKKKKKKKKKNPSK